MKYFNDSDLFELFEFTYTDAKQCETLKLLLERDGFNIQKTPTVERHLKFLTALEAEEKVTGLSLNSNLYSKSEEKQADIDEDLELNSDDLREIERQSNSTQEDKTPSR